MQRYESYKSSGVKWLGDIPENWDVCRNIGLFDERKEINQPDMELLSVTINRGVIKQEEITEKKDSSNEDKSKYKVVRKDDLAYNKMRMWQGAIGRSEYEGIVSPAYVILSPRDRLYSRYYHYLYRTEAFIAEANRNSYGLCLDMNSLRYEDFKTIYSPVPPRTEVERIVAFLDQKTAEIDAAIAKKERLIELLGEQKEGLISRAVLLGLRQQVELRKSSIKWLKNIPNGWEELPCRYLFREVTRRDRDGSEQKLSVTQRNGLVPTDQMAEHSTQAQSFDEFKLCHVGDLVLNKYKAHLGVFWAAKVRGIITNNYTVFRPTKKAFPPYFELLFHTKWMCDQFASVVYGIVDGMMPLYTKDFYSVQTLCPPLHEQQEIVSYCDEVTKKIDSAIAQEERAIQLLRELKTALVTSYVTGKAKV
jgi:type I restriction enzyme S subunit